MARCQSEYHMDVSPDVHGTIIVEHWHSDVCSQTQFQWLQDTVPSTKGRATKIVENIIMLT